jgi:hypothetical protein
VLALVKTVVGQQQEEELGMAQLEADAMRDSAVRSAEEAVGVPSKSYICVSTVESHSCTSGKSLPDHHLEAEEELTAITTGLVPLKRQS